MERAGHLRNQAIAAALRVARGRAEGGTITGTPSPIPALNTRPPGIPGVGPEPEGVPGIPPIPKPPKPLGGDKTEVHTGPIMSHVAGRTDHLPMHVPSGAYVLPADIVSALGEGNTMAGFKIATGLFGQPFYGTEKAGEGKPYHQGAHPYRKEAHPYKPGATPYDQATPHYADGGAVQTDWPHGVANSISEQLQGHGFSTQLTHHNTAQWGGGKSSYLGVSDPQTGRYLRTVRLSDHMTGPNRASQETQIHDPAEAPKIIDWAHEMRQMGPTQVWKDDKLLKEAGLDHLVGNKRTKAITRLRASKAHGGATHTVPIIAAGGEFVIHPDNVLTQGNGDLDDGHKVLDEFVKQVRAKLVKTLKGLPGPAKD
jgi:hypothetical protein